MVTWELHIWCKDRFYHYKNNFLPYLTHWSSLYQHCSTWSILFLLCTSQVFVFGGFFPITVLWTLAASHNNGHFAVVWHEKPGLLVDYKAHSQEKDQFFSRKCIWGNTGKSCLLFAGRMQFVTFLCGFTLLPLFRRIAWYPEVVKKMKWDGATKASCSARDILSPKILIF